MTTCITNVLVYDGSGSYPFRADVIIKDRLIEKIGRPSTLKGDNQLDGQKYALAPGFIDSHSHSDLEVFRAPKMQHVIRQGITTEVVGQDGSSVTPLNDDMVEELAANMAPLAGVLPYPYPWRNFAEYLKCVKEAQPATRIVSLVGHGTIRMMVMGNENRQATSKELMAMKKLLAQCLEEGAKGLSFGLIYPPGSYAQTEELVELCKVIAHYDGIVMVHMRNEQDALLKSLEEMAYVSRQTGVRMHISHLKALGYRNWGCIETALRKIDALRAEGLEVTFDQYPYEATCTGLKVVVPMWAYEGGEKGFQNRLLQAETYEQIRAATQKNIEARGGAVKILIASVATRENSWMAGKTLDVIAKKMQLDADTAALKILQMEGPAVVAIYFSISPDDVKRVMSHPVQGICTDGIIGAHPHPRAYGSFPRVLGYYCRELNIMTMQEAIRRMTFEPARRLRLWDRGLIREGMSADLVLFDPSSIKDMNSYLEPTVYPQGIIRVWVQGEEKYQLVEPV